MNLHGNVCFVMIFNNGYTSVRAIPIILQQFSSTIFAPHNRGKIAKLKRANEFSNQTHTRTPSFRIYIILFRIQTGTWHFFSLLPFSKFLNFSNKKLWRIVSTFREVKIGDIMRAAAKTSIIPYFSFLFWILAHVICWNYSNCRHQHFQTKHFHFIRQIGIFINSTKKIT